MSRVVVPEAEPILDKEFPSLNAGFVRLIDYMGGDESLVQAARVSYGKGTKTVNEDRGLIRYLMRHHHTTPFEMVELKFHVKLPIFVARQWIRHRTANVNEYSGRYSVMKDEFYLPDERAVHFQSKRNKQGRRDDDVPAELRRKVIDILTTTQGELYAEYQSMLDDDIACWFIDTNYNGESFFVRHAYFTGADESYEKLKRALRAEIDDAAWSALYSTTSQPFDPPKTGQIAVKVINHYGDEVLKVWEVG